MTFTSSETCIIEPVRRNSPAGSFSAPILTKWAFDIRVIIAPWPLKSIYPLTSFSIHGTVEKGNIIEVEACNAENLFLKESGSSAKRNSYGGKN